MYVCICNAVSDKDISRAIDEGATTLEQLREMLNVATYCGHCSSFIEARLEQKIERALDQLEPHSA